MHDWLLLFYHNRDHFTISIYDSEYLVAGITKKAMVSKMSLDEATSQNLYSKAIEITLCTYLLWCACWPAYSTRHVSIMLGIVWL